MKRLIRKAEDKMNIIYALEDFPEKEYLLIKFLQFINHVPVLARIKIEESKDC